MKPKIQLVSGCASTFMNEVVSREAFDSGNDGSGTTLAQSGETGAMLERFLQTAIKAMGASVGIVRILSPNRDELRTMVAVDSRGSCQAESIIDRGRGTRAKDATMRSLEIANVEVCKQRYGDVFIGETCKYTLAVQFGNEASEDDPAGVFTLFFATEQSISDVTRRILHSYAEMIKIAVKSVWQSEKMYQSKLLEERQSIANEIHDSLAQTLYYAKIRASLLLDVMKSDDDLMSFKCAQDIDEALETSQKTVRELVTHFRCQMDPKGLFFALQKLVNDFIARTNIKLEYVNRIEALELPKEYELQIFLIVRESLVNVASHSGATIAGLTVSCCDGRCQFVIEDNGNGVGNNEPPEGHYGMKIMRERALRIGGEVRVTSSQGIGTRVQLIFSAPDA
jgi:two-component system nitrate/nitrite sensor histidine kinase NarX